MSLSTKYNIPRIRGPRNKIIVRGDVAYIQLSSQNGLIDKVARIDAEDLTKVRGYNFIAFRRDNDVYAISTVSGERVFLHNLIIGKVDGMVVDHINGNTLDNRKVNLRFCTRGQNSKNKAKRKSGYASQYSGVTWRKDCKMWETKCSGKHVGYFKVEVDAAMAYDNAALELYGEFARLNFPNHKS